MNTEALIDLVGFWLAIFFQAKDTKPIAELGDLLEPDPLVFTFETIGWKVLAVLFLLMAVAVLYKRIKSYRNNKYRRIAIQKVRVIEDEKALSSKKLIQINIILKQVAMVTYGREQVADLFGGAWLSFLDSKTKNKGFINYSNDFIAAFSENKGADKTTEFEIFALTKKWINGHT